MRTAGVSRVTEDHRPPAIRTPGMQIEAVAFDDERGRVGALLVRAMPLVVLLRAAA